MNHRRHTLDARESTTHILPWLALGLASSIAACAFPPAPHHILYGTVRDEFGNPFDAPGTIVFLETEGIPAIRTSVASGSVSGINYRIHVPIDAATTSDRYKPSALRPAAPFRMRVRVGNTDFLPIEMAGVSKLSATPSATTRIDLTLGVDSDGDGLPDAWELALIAATGGNRSLSDIDPKGDTDGDGLTNLQEYIAGTYAFDPEDGFSLSIVGNQSGRSVLEFTALKGRSYSIQASPDMLNWAPVPFTLPTDTPNTTARLRYGSTDVRPIRALVGPFSDSPQPARFFRLMVQ